MNYQQYRLITCATNCMGQELANLFAQCGSNLILVSGDISGLEKMAGELRSEYGISVLSITEDGSLHDGPFSTQSILMQLGFAALN